MPSPISVSPATLRATLTTTCFMPQDAAPGAGAWSIHPSVLAYVIGEVLAVVFVVRVLTRGGSAAATLNWVLIILITPYAGLLLYYLLPRRIQLKRLKRRANKMSWISSQLAEVVPASASTVNHDGLTRLLCRLDPDAVHDGNRLTLLETGADFVADSVEWIERAEDFVHLETYIFRPDRTGLRLLELLTRAARRGVEVRLLYDSLGSWSLKRAHLQPLVAAGGRAKAYLPLLWRHRPFTLNLRNHRKLLVVDGKVCILGGRNVGDEYATDHFGDTGRWLDTMVKVEGPAVRRLHRVFVEDWYNAAEEDLAQERYFPDGEALGSDRLGIVVSGPDAPTNALSWMFFQLIVDAERTLDISSPYLIPNPVVLTAMQVAATRGVRVRIHTNGRGVAQGILHRAQRSHYSPLLDAGVEITEGVADYNHSKMILVDERRLLVGSPNLDVRSEELNFEIAVVTEGDSICTQARDLFARRLASGRRVHAADLEPRWWDPLANGVCRLLSPVL